MYFTGAGLIISHSAPPVGLREQDLHYDREKLRCKDSKSSKVRELVANSLNIP